MKKAAIKAPFPAFGGKSTIAHEVWKRFGQVRNFVEPFANSCAVLFHRPEPWNGTETVNDYDGLIANFWRAVKYAPEQTSEYADWPVNENDLHARHVWLVGKKDSLQARLEGDPEFYDTKVAGWWVWGSCCWICSGWCSGEGPWQVQDGKLVHLGSAGRGVNRKRVHLGNAGRGVNRKLVHLGSAGRGVNRKREQIHELFAQISDRLRDVRVCCGDWSRVCGPTPTVKQGLTAIFLDPPYPTEAARDATLYRVEDLKVAHDAAAWAIAQGQDPRIRIAFCGYEGSHVFPPDWETLHWKANGGYASQKSIEKRGHDNSRRERIWFSPHCIKPKDTFDFGA